MRNLRRENSGGFSREKTPNENCISYRTSTRRRRRFIVIIVLALWFSAEPLYGRHIMRLARPDRIVR